MNTILFLAGCGCGVLLTFVALWSLSAIKSLKPEEDHSIRNMVARNHAEIHAVFIERNRLLAEQNKTIAEIRDAIDPL